MAGEANSINSTTTGIVGNTGTGFTSSSVTQYDVLVGGATSSTIASVGPGSAGQVLQSGGNAANPSYSTATYPSTATGTGKILRANGTDFVASTSTFADTYSASNILYSNGSNTITGLATENSAILATNSSGVPSITTASGNWNNTSRTCFSAHLGSNVTNATGAGTTWQLGTTTALTIDFDQGSNFNTNGTFTAPVTGKYFFQGYALISNCSTATIFLGRITASGINYDFQWTRNSSSNDGYVTSSVIVSMSANDTATFSVNVQGEATNRDTVVGNQNTRFTGYLIC